MSNPSNRQQHTKDKTEIVVYNLRGFNFIKKNKMFKQNQLKSIKLSG
jgi:hypothetical protein